MIRLPENVKFIIEKLQDAGFDAYAVGGCVRDVLLGKEPNDWDITTDASPYEVKPLFRRTIDTGIKHGTVTVMLNDENGNYTGYEVTTYRIDGEYEDSEMDLGVGFERSPKAEVMSKVYGDEYLENEEAYREIVTDSILDHGTLFVKAVESIQKL